ncbi:hypothetical protein LXL04_023150 [Taraxacum kok-saghyz]
MQDKRGKTMGYTKIREGNQKYKKLQGNEMKDTEKRCRNELSAILDKFRTVLPLTLPGGEGITNNFGAVLDLYSPVTSSRTMAFEEMMSRFLEKHFDRFTHVSYLLRHCAQCSGKMTTNDSQTWYHI